MKRAEFEKECEKAEEKLSAFDFTGDAKADLKTLNDGIRIVRVTRIVKRARFFTGAALAVLAAVGLVTGGCLSRDKVLLAAFVVLGAFLASVGVWYFLSHINNVTHKAVCIIENGKVREYIYSRKGGFVFNTVEGETVCEKGKVLKQRHDYTKYEPSYPYVDFLDRDFRAFLKSRGGGDYDVDEFYFEDEKTETISVYSDEKKKKNKFTLYLQEKRPYKMEYKNLESFVYSRMNDGDLALFVPLLLKGKLSTPDYLKVEYFDGSSFRDVWERI